LNKLFYIALSLILFASELTGQVREQERYIQMSGIVTDVYSRPVPGVAVISKKLRRGNISEKTGIYSITTTPGDTVFFRALGFKRYHTIIPSDYPDRQCNADIMLEADTIQIAAVNIMPWKTYKEFLKEITKERPKDPLIENMNDNIASIYVALANQTGVKVSGATGYRYAMEQNFSATATRQQYPVNNLLNPFAWAKFVDGIKHGLFKNQKFTRPEQAKVRKKKKNASK
jgi:hypothetical protein